jgi:hypothetical protein
MNSQMHPLQPPDALQWKMIYLARRNPALAEGDFAQAWREHSALGRQCRNVQDKVLGVTQCTRIMGGSPSGANTDYDGVNLLQLRDLGVASDIWNDPETRAIMRPDEPRVFDRYVRDFTLVTHEQVLTELPPGDAVLVGFMRRVPGLAQAEFVEGLTKLTTPWPQTGRVVLNVVEPERPVGYDFDAIIEWWFQDAEALGHASMPSDLRMTVALSMGHLCDMDATVLMATQVTHRRP